MQTTDAQLEERLPLLFSSDTPDIKSQFEEFRRAGGTSTIAVQRDRADRIRYNRWKGRTGDYKKHRKALGAEPIPWENAWDGRVYLADSIIEDLGDVLSSAFERAQIKAKPTEVGDTVKAGLVEKILQKYREKIAPSLRDEAEFLWQFGLNTGASVAEVGWESVLSMKMDEVSMDEFGQAATNASKVLMQTPPNAIDPDTLDKLQRLATFPQIIMDPLQEPAAIELLQLFARDMAGQLFAEQRLEFGDDFLLNYELTATTAKKVIRSLREDGKAKMPAPYISKNEPSVVARELGVDYFCPPEMADIQASPWHAVREFLTPEEVWQKQITEGWDATWVRETLKTAGTASQWGDLTQISDISSWDMDDEVDTYDWQAQKSNNGLVEVITFFKRQISEEGVGEIWCTIWCPHVISDPQSPTESLYARHFLFEDLPNKYPFVGFRWQKKKRQFCNSMGVPQLVGSDQHAIKASLDMLHDLSEKTVNPEWLVDQRLGLRYKFGPGAQLTRRRQGDIEPVPTPRGNPELAFKLVESTEARLANYFGLMSPAVLPAKWQAKLQRLVERYLGTCAEMWDMMLMLIQKRVSSETLQRIAGMDPGLPSDLQDIAAEYDVALYFDARDLDMEFTLKKLDAITKMAVPLDRAGLVDFSALVKLIMYSIDPTYATALIKDQASASQQMFNDVRSQIALMERGNIPDFTENDPAAETKLQFANQIIYGDGQGNGGNPIYQAALKPGTPQFNPVFAQRLQQWSQNMQQSIAQARNAQIGRLGVDPNAKLQPATA